MLQRQIMFKQLQELQRRQQLQELGNARNQDYVDHQLSSLKQDPQMFSIGNVQMAQHGGSPVFQGFHNGLGPMGLSQPQFDVSSYGNSNQYSHNLQEAPPFASSFTSQQGNFGQVPVQSLNTGWLGISHGEASEIASDSLDPLEQKILYNTEDNNSWEFSFGGNSKMENTSYMDALPSTQKGSWSALMQSAVTEASSSDTAMQEEWSGLSFQNPELSTENQPSSFVNSENPHNNWVDRNLQNVSSPSSEPSNMNYSSQGFKQPEYQYLKQRDEFQPNVFSCSTEKNPCIDFSGHELKDTLWLPGNTSNSVSDGIQRDCSPGMQLTSKVSSLNQLPLTETSVASIANPCNTSHLESQGFGFRPGPTDVGTTQSHSLFPSFSMGNSNATSVSSHYGNDYIKNQLPAPSVQSHMTTKLPAYNAASSQVNRQLKTASFSGPEFPWSDINSQQDMSSSKPNRFSDSLFQSPDSASSSLETTSGAPSEQPNQSRFKHELNVQEFRTNSGKSGYGEQRFEKESSFDEGSTEMHNPTSLSINMQTQESLRAFGHSLHQNDPLLHKLHSPRNAEIDYGKNLPLKYDSVNYQTIANARELLLSGQKQVLQDSEDKKGWNFSQDKEDHSGKNNAQNNLIGRNEVSNTAYQSPTTLQMSPPWLQHYGTLKNGLTIANVHENSPIMQVNSANASQGSGVWPSSAVALIASQHLSSPSMLPSNVSNYQNLALSKPMKRKIIAFEMVPWHKEVNHQEPRLHNIRMAELEWAQASKRREEEAEIVEDVVPLARAKRRLIFTTQLMQQVFRPAPAVILFADAKSNCDDVAYSAARLALGDACNLISNLPPDNTDMYKKSPDKLRTSKKPRVCDLSKVVEGLINRVQKLEGDLSRLDQKISIVDIKVEIQELEKFSTINRFAKFHVKANSSTVDSTSSSGQSTVHKPNPQRYVRALPLPKTLPEGTDCLSL